VRKKKCDLGVRVRRGRAYGANRRPSSAKHAAVCRNTGDRAPERQRRWLVLGVAPGHISTLHTMPRSELPQAPAPAAPPEDVLLLREIRDSLKK